MCDKLQNIIAGIAEADGPGGPGPEAKLFEARRIGEQRKAGGCPTFRLLNLIAWYRKGHVIERISLFAGLEPQACRSCLHHKCLLVCLYHRQLQRMLVESALSRKIVCL